MEIQNRDNILHVAHYNAAQMEEKGLFIFDEVVIYRVTHGGITVMRGEQQIELKEGDSFILAEHSHTHIEPHSPDSSITICSLSKSYTDKIYLLIDIKMVDIIFGTEEGGYICQNDPSAATNHTLDKLFAQHNDFSHPMRGQYIYSLIYCYLLELYKEAFHLRKSTSSGSSKYVSYSIDRFFLLCQEHHAKEHTSEFYAKELGLSNRYLYKIVKSVSGQTPKQVINSYLMESARRLLLTTTHSTMQIAELLNFPDQSAFGQFFKRNAGMSPSEFRHRY